MASDQEAFQKKIAQPGASPDELLRVQIGFLCCSPSPVFRGFFAVHRSPVSLSLSILEKSGLKIRYEGLLFIALGFSLPYLLDRIFPAFMYAMIPSFVSFWVGFLILLKPKDANSNTSDILSWTKYSIWLNMILMVICGLYFWILSYWNIERAPFMRLMLFIGSATNPIRVVFDSIIPLPTESRPKGTFILIHTFIRSQLTYFFSLILYMLIAGFIKGMLLKKDNLVTSAGNAGRP